MNLDKHEALHLVKAFQNVSEKDPNSYRSHMLSTVTHNMTHESKHSVLAHIKSAADYDVMRLCNAVHNFWGRKPSGQSIHRGIADDPHQRLILLGLTDDTSIDKEEPKEEPAVVDAQKREVYHKQDTVYYLSQQTGKTQKECRKMLEQVTDAFIDILAAGYDLQVWEFGRFLLKDKPARDTNAFGRTIHLKDRVQVQFRPATRLKKELEATGHIDGEGDDNDTV